ncbi:MAG: hypothetical protein HY290_03285, partial [Planctomycetia bacterium]|nr:hypothetical protein [Planctomycetia bacterium]
MKTRNRNWKSLLAAAVLFLVAARGAIAEEAIPGDKRLPKNVVAYMSLKNVNEFKTQWPKTLFGQMLSDDSLAELRGDFLKQFEQSSQEVRERIGLGLAELLAIPQGEVTVAGVILPSGGIGGAMLLDFGDQSEALHKLIDKAHEGLDAADLTRNEEEVEDTKLILFQHKAGEGNDEARDAGGYFVKDTVLVIASHASVLKDVLTRWNGKHDHTFSEHESFQYILERCRDQDSEARPQFTWFVDPVGLFQAVASANPELLGPAAAAPGLMPILGFDKFKGFGGTVDMGQGDFDTISRTLVLLERAPQGIGNLFQFDLAAQSPPKWLSTDWTSYMVINWNAGKAYATVESFTDMFLGPVAL